MNDNKFFPLARSNMVKNQIITNQVSNQNLIDAFLEVKKELFVDTTNFSVVYSDSNILLKKNRFLMKTFTFAKMLENCDVKSNESILVLSCLTGYSVAIISKVAGYVFGIEKDNEFVKKANEILISQGYLNCSVYQSNPADGLKKNAPFDKIIIEGGVDYIPISICKQLKEDGKIFFMKRKSENYIFEFTVGLKNNNTISYRPLFSCNSFMIEDFTNPDKNEDL